jgi:hypothetical protein
MDITEVEAHVFHAQLAAPNVHLPHHAHNVETAKTQQTSSLDLVQTSTADALMATMM